MSKTRVVLRILLVLVVAGAAWIGFIQWRKMYPQYYFEKAEAAAEREEFESARLYLAKLIKKHPNNAEAHRRMSQLILQEARANGQPARYRFQPGAVAHLARAAELDPSNDDLQLRLLSAYVQRREITKAAPIAERVYADDKTNGDAHLVLVWRAVLAKDDETARRLFEESSGVVSRYPFHEFGLKLTHYLEQKDTAKWQGALIDAIETASDLTAEQIGLLDYTDREMMLQVLLMGQQQTSNPTLATRIADVVLTVCEKMQQENLLNSETVAEAASQSQAILQRGASRGDLDERQRRLHQNLVGRAGDISAEVVSAAGDGSLVTTLRPFWVNAISLFGKGESEQALEVVEKGITAGAAMDEPPRAQIQELHLLAARILMAENRLSEAADHLDHLKGEDRLEGWGHLLRGNMALRDGNHAAALVELELANGKLGSTLQVHTGIARALLGQRRWQEAIPHLQATLKPDEDLSEADQAWRRQRFGFNDRVHFDLLKARLALGDWENAQESIRHLRDTEFAPQVWRVVVRYLWDNGDRDKARRYLKLSRDKFPDDIDLVFLDASLHAEEGKSSRADFTFQDFVGERPDDAVRRLALARWHLGAEQADKALRELSKVREFTITPKAENTLHLLTAQAYFQKGQFDLARPSVERLIASDDTIAAGYLMKTMIHDAKGEDEIAEQWLNRANAASRTREGSDPKSVTAMNRKGEPLAAIVVNTFYW